MIVKAYKAEHLVGLGLQEKQQYLSSWVTPDMAKVLENDKGLAFTALDDYGNVLAIAGVLEQWENRGMAWAYLADTVDCRNFILVHRAVARFLKICTINRVEMTVDCDFEQAHRWARKLGFTMEVDRMRAYRPDGGDCALYSRVLTWQQ